MRFTAEISCFESTFDTDTIEELDEDGDVGDLQVKRRILEREKIALVTKKHYHALAVYVPFTSRGVIR